MTGDIPCNNCGVKYSDYLAQKSASLVQLSSYLGEWKSTDGEWVLELSANNGEAKGILNQKFPDGEFRATEIQKIIMNKDQSVELSSQPPCPIHVEPTRLTSCAGEGSKDLIGFG